MFKIGKYLVEKEIGAGSFGKVYKVLSGEGEQLALKLFEPNESVLKNIPLKDLQKRFSREVRYQERIHHPNIVSVLDFDISENNEKPWFVMPLAIGTLADELKGEKDYDVISRALFDILSGLEELHAKDCVHRDLKPENVLAFKKNDKVSFALSDFGLITALQGESTNLTGSGAQGGTAMYAAPECMHDFRKATAAADVYSFGAILHDVYDGSKRFPYVEQTGPEFIKHIIEKCTKTVPARRYANISDLRVDLHDALKEPVTFELTQDDQKIINLITSKDSLSSGEWDEVYLYLQKVDNDSTKQVIYTSISHKQLEGLFNDSYEILQAFGLEFADIVRKGVFPFSLCDVLCDKLLYYYEYGKLALKANILIALLFMGTSHNRWYVEGKFADRAGADMDDELADRFIFEMCVADLEYKRALVHLCDSISIKIDSLHNAIGILYTEGCND